MPFRILLVEDDRASRQGLSALLSGAGYSVAETASMADALDIIQHDPPDLIITDIRLQEFNGLYLAAVNPLRIPVVIVTGYPDPGLEQEARNLGADFLLKPIRPSRLLTIVEQRLPLTTDGEGFALARRWPRRRPTMELPAQVDNTQVRVLDVSYGGMRLVGGRDANFLSKQAFSITFPTAALSVPVRVVWKSESHTDRLCGATVPEEWQPPWRQLVDAVS
ncbi:MAG TPA: response regulator [Vicinamibacterales bacterium]|nr:response regulator [Vicinamibacterales bacterium]